MDGLHAHACSPAFGRGGTEGCWRGSDDYSCTSAIYYLRQNTNFLMTAVFLQRSAHTTTRPSRWMWVGSYSGGHSSERGLNVTYSSDGVKPVCQIMMKTCQRRHTHTENHGQTLKLESKCQTHGDCESIRIDRSRERGAPVGPSNWCFEACSYQHQAPCLYRITPYQERPPTLAQVSNPSQAVLRCVPGMIARDPTHSP